jgi:para-nitrobenzyl esterase
MLSTNPNSRILTVSGLLEGRTDPDTGIHSFKGIPFAAPPVGVLRWKPPQPVQSWSGVRQADRFGPRAMQLPVFGDMNFRSNGVSEDCLYLNVWTPSTASDARLPVLVYFYGGGFLAGDGSEPRYDGGALARRGIVALTVNYRLNVFGFFAHPELTRESPHPSSSNYGYLDQAAALAWVQQNITAFGGDPTRVTIAGESAGSISVSAQMASPLSKGLIAGAIGSSGSLMGALPPVPLAEAEQIGLAFAKKVGAASLTELRAIPAQQLLEATDQIPPQEFPGSIDGYFFPRSPYEIFAKGEQAHIPLMVGWNSEEMNYQDLLGPGEPTPRRYAQVVRERWGEHAAEILRLYPASNTEEVVLSATDLAGDLFIAYSTWKWADVHGQTGGSPVYRYFYTRPRPPMKPSMGDAMPGLAGGVLTGPEAEALRQPPARGAVHSADIEYAMGNLSTNLVYAWTAEDYQVSEILQTYYANFVKTGNPNGSDLPDWRPANQGDPAQVMRLDVDPCLEAEQHRDRYLYMDQFYR